MSRGAQTVSPDLIRELLDCDYATGSLVWRPRTSRLIPNDKGRALWNARFAGNRANNAIDNLRCVSRTQNMRNMKMSDRNKSGIVGVYWSKGRQKWVANISLAHRTVYLGIFSDINEAALARKKAEQEHGFHENHGRAA